MVGLSGLPQGKGPALTTLVVGDAAPGSPRTRVWTSRRTRLPRQAWFRARCARYLTSKREAEVRYYLERRDLKFKQKMAEVPCVYREVRLIKETARADKNPAMMRWRLSPTMRSSAFRPLPRPHRNCRRSSADIRPSRAITSSAFPKFESYRVPGVRGIGNRGNRSDMIVSIESMN
jgi:hypothetical protein